MSRWEVAFEWLCWVLLYTIITGIALTLLGCDLGINRPRFPTSPLTPADFTGPPTPSRNPITIMVWRVGAVAIAIGSICFVASFVVASSFVPPIKLIRATGACFALAVGCIIFNHLIEKTLWIMIVGTLLTLVASFGLWVFGQRYALEKIFKIDFNQDGTIGTGHPEFHPLHPPHS